jgi:hypothetical protein
MRNLSCIAPIRCWSRLLLALMCLAPLTGCIHDGVHAPVLANLPTVDFTTPDAKVDHKHRNDPAADRNHATVEFLENGKLADSCPTGRVGGNPPCQQTFAVKYIQEARKMSEQGAVSKDLVVIAFIHGNENYAGEGSDNYPHFRQMINCLNLGTNAYKAKYSQYFDSTGEAHHGVLGCKDIPEPVSTAFVGIYLGWRGNTNHTPINLRERTAVQIASGPDMIPTLYMLRDAAKKGAFKKPARFVVLGHSFGGLLLEQTATRIYETAFNSGRPEMLAPCSATAGTPKGFMPFTDMLVTMNPAVNGVPAKKLIEFFQSKDGSFCHSADAAPALYRPLLVTLVSKDDFWSRPIGSKLRHTFGGETACKGYASCSEEKKQAALFDSNDVWQNDPQGKLVFGSTAANLTFFQNLCYLKGDGTTPGEQVCEWDMSKLLGATPPKGLALPTEYAPGRDSPINHLFVRFDCRGDKGPTDPTTCKTPDAYQHHDDLHIWNRTPYWIGEIDSTVIRGHNDFWDSEFVTLLVGITHAFPVLRSDQVIPNP